MMFLREAFGGCDFSVMRLHFLYERCNTDEVNRRFSPCGRHKRGCQ